MRLTTKGRYAVTAMLDLTIHDSNGPTSLAEISKRQEISLSYLEQLFAKLRRSGLVSSVRGPGGGYRLGMPSNDISIAKIINAVNESTDVTQCRGKANCHKGDMCLTHHLWCDLSDQIQGFLDNISLAELISRKDIQKVALKQETGSEA